jgi:peptidyl-prolyl cis-trans isomerase A (cyclophilin A)
LGNLNLPKDNLFIMSRISKPLVVAAGICCLALGTATATEVQFRTVMGEINVNLFDDVTPQTVTNFLSYVNSGAYANNVVHRSEPGFVVQAGGFWYGGVLPLDSVATGTPVVNEAELSNVRGTLAMAKSPGNANSATSQWFFNLGNNSANLDAQNGGFTVFGQVLGNGMEVVDAIAQLNRFDLGGAANNAPLRNYSQADVSAGVTVTDEHLVIITDIVVTDTATLTHGELNPPVNTLINKVADASQDSAGGGSLSGFSAIALLLIGIRKRFFIQR